MNNNLSLKFLAGTLSLLTCLVMMSCAIVYPIDAPDNSTAKRLNFVDSRPYIEKTFRPSSRASEPVDRFGDENFQPDRMTILEQTLQNKLNDSFSGSTVRIQKFEVFSFCPNAIGMARGYSKESFEMMFGPLFGPVLYNMNAPKGSDFFGCQIEGDINGKEFKAFSKEEFSGLVDMGAAKKAVNILIKRTIDMTVQEINSLSMK